MKYNVVFSPLAEAQLDDLYKYIAHASTAVTASRYVHEIIDYCVSLSTFPLRGTSREDLRSGLRITNHKKRVVIAFQVQGNQVTIVSVFYGGQDYETLLSGDEHDLSD